MERIHEEPIAVYEKKIHGEELTKWSYGSDYLDVNYKNYVENLLKNTGVIPSDEVDKLQVSEEVLLKKFFQLLDIVPFQLSPEETKDWPMLK